MIGLFLLYTWRKMDLSMEKRALWFGEGNGCARSKWVKGDLRISESG